jgi:hypothetical protein
VSVCRAAVLLLLAGPVPAQSLRVLSEFQRVDPFGEVVAADRTPQPREILSPGVARNAFASFQIAATVPERTPFFLFAQSNPPDIFQISLYEELYVKTGAGWIPDALEPAKVPAFGALPYLPSPIPKQNTLSYWLDLWVPADAPVQRVRLEVLMKIGSGWVMYPMEVRVLPAVVPTVPDHHAALPPASARSDAPAWGSLRNFLCNTRDTGRDERLSTRRLIHRNATQDVALARSLDAAHQGDVRAAIVRRIGLNDRVRWCQSPLAAGELDTEWPLRVRDLLYRIAGGPAK